VVMWMGGWSFVPELRRYVPLRFLTASQDGLTGVLKNGCGIVRQWEIVHAD